MITALIFQSVVGFINIAFSWLPIVTTLPTVGDVDLDYVVGAVASIFVGFREALPPFDVLMSALFWYYGILILLLTWSFVRWFIGLIRGSGS